MAASPAKVDAAKIDGATIGTRDASQVPPQQSLRMAMLVVSILPILAVYPFLQKHFAKGIMIGAVKG